MKLAIHNEGMADVMLEAMAAGVPVVATDVGGVRAALAAEGGGPPAGADEVARRTGEALRRVRQRFGVERMVEACERVLFGPCT